MIELLKFDKNCILDLDFGLILFLLCWEGLLLRKIVGELSECGWIYLWICYGIYWKKNLDVLTKLNGILLYDFNEKITSCKFWSEKFRKIFESWYSIKLSLEYCEFKDEMKLSIENVS